MNLQSWKTRIWPWSVLHRLELELQDAHGDIETYSFAYHRQYEEREKLALERNRLRNELETTRKELSSIKSQPLETSTQLEEVRHRLGAGGRAVAAKRKQRETAARLEVV